MEGTIAAFDFQLAEHLHLTLGEVAALPNSEWIAWRAWLTYRAAMAEMEQSK